MDIGSKIDTGCEKIAFNSAKFCSFNDDAAMSEAGSIRFVVGGASKIAALPSLIRAL